MCAGCITGMIGHADPTDEAIFSYIGLIGYDRLGSVGIPPAYALLMKLCAEFTGDIRIFCALNGCIQSVLAGLYIYTGCSRPYAGAVMLSAGFMPASFVGTPFFTAVLICCCAMRYIRERRFFRFAAMILAAACFDISAVLLIPLYFITLIPNVYITAVISAAAASLAAIYSDITASVFSFLGFSLTVSLKSTVPCAVCACLAALICLLMHRMIANRDEKYAYLIPFAAMGAALSAAGVHNGMLFPVSVFLLAGSLTSLAPEVYELLLRFFGILFPKKPYTVGLAVNTACFAAVIGFCAYTLFSGCFGSEVFGQALFGEGTL